MLLFFGCGPVGPVDPLTDVGVTGPDGDTDNDASSDAGYDADTSMEDTGPLSLCETEPSHWPERPRWGEITSGYPDYEDVMTNFNILDSLQLLASMMTKAVSGLNTLANTADDETTGECICNCSASVNDWSTLPENPAGLANWAQVQPLTATCYATGQTREQCGTMCDAGNFPAFTAVAEIDSDENFLWIASDTFKKPNGDPRYALQLVKLIDQMTGFLSAGGTCTVDADCGGNDAVCDGGTCKSKLRQVLDAMSAVGAELTQRVQQIIAAMEQVETVINRFTEGFHLGGYSTQRPDLHMCVGWAGHGAFAQLENLSSDKVSIGARYSSHVISHSRRVQLRTGGFGVSALGKSLSILPTPEVNIQIDGWKVWNADKPFGIDFPTGGIDVSTIGKYDAFELVDQNQVADLAGVDGIITPGELILVDFYPATYIEGSTGATQEWPRSMNHPSNPWIPWTGWEGEPESRAVFSAGLNLPLEIEPIEKTLPTIPIFPPYASLTPYFRLGAGVEWIHDAFYLRERIREKVNENLAPADHLTDADFERNMHALQAPDLSEDNGTTAYVNPELGATLTFGLQLSKFATLGINAALGVGARVQPGGWGGLVDLNYALVQTLVNSNPPADAPCTPIWDDTTTKSCSNKNWPASTGDYACTSETSGLSSCCIQVGSEKVCVESWTGITEEFCEAPGGFVAGDGFVSQVQLWLNHLTLYAGHSAVNSLRDEVSDAVQVTSRWNEAASCALARCTDGLHLPSIAALSECKKRGACYDAAGEVLAHDVTEGVCLGHEQEGPGRCCSEFGEQGYGSVACGGSQLDCIAADGLWVPGGICSNAVDLSDCSNDHDVRLGNTNLTWIPYACITSVKPEVTGWEGAGCHPLNNGFPSACGCVSTQDCAAGEVCNGDNQCEDPAGPTSCVCDPTDATSCPSGRTCIEGACAKNCVTDADCPSAFVCGPDQACVTEHNIPTAESIVWGMQNGAAPLHAVSTYAMSEMLFLAYLAFGLDIGLDIRLFGKTFDLTIYELARTWDLGSTNKAWYQPGLEARYQSQCTDPADQLVTNRQPNPVTAASGVNLPTIGVFEGYVSRYPEPQNNQGTLDPNQEGNACHPGAGDCTWEDLVAWCMDEIPENVIDPPAPNFDDLTDALTDTVDWGEDIGLQLWDSGQVCVGGEPWYEWVQNVNGSLDNLECLYQPETGPSVTFSCGQAALVLLEQFGCLDTDLNSLAQQIASTYPSYTINGGAQFDATAMMIDATGEFATYNIRPQFLFIGLMPVGIWWMNSVEACFAESLEVANRCPCTSDAQCPGEGDTCSFSGYCINGGSQYSQCAPFALVNPPEPEPCCGDGIVQEFEECDDGNTMGGDGCSSYCTLEADAPPQRGACCLRTVEGFQCSEGQLDGAQCLAREGTFFAGQSCATIECG